jgi:hypothetical protein
MLLTQDNAGLKISSTGNQAPRSTFEVPMLPRFRPAMLLYQMPRRDFPTPIGEKGDWRYKWHKGELKWPRLPFSKYAILEDRDGRKTRPQSRSARSDGALRHRSLHS